jgi:hypothetical protein
VKNPLIKKKQRHAKSVNSHEQHAKAAARVSVLDGPSSDARDERHRAVQDNAQQHRDGSQRVEIMSSVAHRDNRGGHGTPVSPGTFGRKRR